MYSYIHVPDLCEVTPAPRPAEHFAVVLFTADGVTGNSDDGVLTSDT